jgi:alkylated DNA repair dioxygenase AlkB
VFKWRVAQRHLFAGTGWPPGFDYRDDFLAPAEERVLLDELAQLAFAPVEMRGVVARRRTVHFGWTYGYYSRRTGPGPPLPAFLLPYRERTAAWARLDPGSLVEALITEYPPGAPIGWHRDAPMFGDVIAGISLCGPCRMKFRPYVSPGDAGRRATQVRRTTHEIVLAPRSAYLIAGVSRREYEHSIPGVDALRYSITFRTLRAGGTSRA